VGYSISAIPNLLVYDIQVDPSLGMMFSMAMLAPFFYGSIKFGLYNVKIIAKQAFAYGLMIAVIGGIMFLINYYEKIISQFYPGFPNWTIPLLLSVLMVSIGVIVWRTLREGDLLKNEFVTVVTHKFRTPLTHIKWASENLRKSSTLSEDDRLSLNYIQSANDKLVELTDLLVNASYAKNDRYFYKTTPQDICALASETINSVKYQADNKKIGIKADFPDSLIVKIDQVRVKFIIQTFVENAISYSPEGSLIEVRIREDQGNVIFSVKDQGIGIPKEEENFIFNQFYRGKKARLTDTEGMGIGLYISKQIIDNHKGKIWAESEGLNKGSTFSFSIPMVENS
jgi:signal transduction histidine kinase